MDIRQFPGSTVSVDFVVFVLLRMGQVARKKNEPPNFRMFVGQEKATMVPFFLLAIGGRGHWDPKI